MWSLLRDVRIRTVWIGETVNELGTALSFWAWAWILYDRYPEAPWVAGAAIALRSAFGFAGDLIFGPYLDLWDRRRVLVASNALLAGLTATVPFLVEPGWGVWAVLGVLGLQAMVGSLEGPAMSALLAGMAPAGQYQRVYALFSLTHTLGNLLAPVLAGVLIAALGPVRVLWLDAATFAVAAGAYALVRPPASPGGRGSAGWWRQFREGLGFVLGRRHLWLMFLVASLTNTLVEVYNAVLLPRIADRLLEGLRVPAWLSAEPGALVSGLLDALTVGVELAATVWLGSRLLPPRRAWNGFALGCGAVLLGIGAVSAAPGLGLAALAAMFQGLGFAHMGVLGNSLAAALTPDPLRGRVASVRLLLGRGVRSLGSLLAGWAVGAAGVTSMAVLACAAGLGFVAWAWARAVRDPMPDSG